MREYILYFVIAALAVYAWRDWFVSLCGLILLTTLAERKDMPAQIAGIPGANAWNLLLVAIVIAWLVCRRRERLVWDMPRGATLLLVAYVLVLFVAWGRAAFDLGSFPSWYRPNLQTWTTDELLNPLKYMMPALMLYDGCRTRRRVVMALVTVLLVGVGYALLVIKCMPVGALFSGGHFIQYRHRINRETGLHACSLATILVGGLWGILATLGMWKGLLQRAVAWAGAAAMFLGLALCQTRAAYIGAVAVGLVFGIVRWRVLLILLPVAVIVICAVMPSIPARLGMGWGEVNVAGEAATNWDEATAGRAGMWADLVEEIAAAPIMGHGRKGLLRGRLCPREGMDDLIGHPHNAYFEALLDAGLVGFAIMIALYAGLAWIAVRAFRNSEDPLVSAVGGAALASLGAFLVSCFSTHSLFPTISMVGLWCLCAILMRTWVSSAASSSLVRGRPSQRAPWNTTRQNLLLCRGTRVRRAVGADAESSELHSNG